MLLDRYLTFVFSSKPPPCTAAASLGVPDQPDIHDSTGRIYRYRDRIYAASTPYAPNPAMFPAHLAGYANQPIPVYTQNAGHQMHAGGQAYGISVQTHYSMPVNSNGPTVATNASPRMNMRASQRGEVFLPHGSEVRIKTRRPMGKSRWWLKRKVRVVLTENTLNMQPPTKRQRQRWKKKRLEHRQLCTWYIDRMSTSNQHKVQQGG